MLVSKLPCCKSLSIAHRLHGVSKALRQNTGVAVNPRDLKLNEINDTVSAHPNKRVLIIDFYQLNIDRVNGNINLLNLYFINIIPRFEITCKCIIGITTGQAQL